MKSKIYITIIFIAALSMLSCEDFLTTDLRGEYTTESFYNSAENATMSVNAIYNSLYGNTLWIFGDVASDDAVKGGNAGDQADINAINDFSAKSD
ncbi:MAG: RagB/SusD family nutrient uptake outer membrane protein, partial [Bacteroidales bacterium]|nr:RagB/SusD family nutrient uptake outer membrane protein [Bacteroidales bacterium]